MIAAKIDPITRDLVLGEDGCFVMVEGPEVIAQEVRLVLQTWKDEWFFDVNQGTDYAAILGQIGVSDAQIEDVITEAVYQVDAVQSIENMKILRQERGLLIRLRALLEDESGLNIAIRPSSGAPVNVEVNANA